MTMDNAAFRNLLSSGGGEKRAKERGGVNKNEVVHDKKLTTKEIARKAVEEEFEQRKKRRRNHGQSINRDYYSDDDDDDNKKLSSNRKGDFAAAQLSSDEEAGLYDTATRQEDKEQNEPRWKKDRREKRKDQEGPQYRDRAKERRLGLLNPDYKESSKLEEAAKHVDPEMSKYLGGDEQHTHLVKGLDFALARREKEKILAKQKCVPYSQSLSTRDQRNSQDVLMGKTLAGINMGDLDSLRDEASKQQKTQHNEKTVQCNRSRDESMVSNSQKSSESRGSTDHNMRKKERKKKHKKEKKRRKKEKKKAKKKTKHNETNADNRESDIYRNDDNGSDSSEDIFAVSGKYVPPDKALVLDCKKEEVTSEVDTRTSKVAEFTKAKKAEIFEETEMPGDKTTAAKEEDIDSLDRNALIAKLTQRGNSVNNAVRAQNSKKLTDMGLSSYQGDYGEDVDLDFDGSMEQEVLDALQASRIRSHGRDGPDSRKKDNVLTKATRK